MSILIAECMNSACNWKIYKKVSSNGDADIEDKFYEEADQHTKETGHRVYTDINSGDGE